MVNELHTSGLLDQGGRSAGVAKISEGGGGVEEASRGAATVTLIHLADVLHGEGCVTAGQIGSRHGKPWPYELQFAKAARRPQPGPSKRYSSCHYQRTAVQQLLRCACVNSGAVTIRQPVKQRTEAACCSTARHCQRLLWPASPLHAGTTRCIKLLLLPPKRCVGMPQPTPPPAPARSREFSRWEQRHGLSLFRGDRAFRTTAMSTAQAITEVWDFFDADGKGYIESEGLAEALAARLAAVEPHNLQARTMAAAVAFDP